MAGRLAGASVPTSPRRRSWRWRLLALSAVVVVAAAVGLAVYSQTTAPNPFLPARSVMVGSWRRPTGAVLTLRGDGTFTARGLPGNAGEASSLNIPSRGDGRWHVGSYPAEPAGVVFDFSARVEMELLVERIGSSVVMYYDKGDPDQGTAGQYQFTKTR